MKMKPSPFNEYQCPECDEDVRVELPAPSYVECQHCKSTLELHPDFEFEDGFWHDRTTLSIVDPEREHMKRMLKHLQSQ
jgi:hypothetical protein